MKKIFISLVLIILTGVAYSQEEDKFLVSEIKQSTVITQPATLNKGFFLLGSVFTYTADDKVFYGNGKKDYEPGNGWGIYSTEYLEFHFGLTNRIELAFFLPYVYKSISYSVISEFPISDTAITTKYKSKGKGVGDIEFGIYYQLIKGSKTKPSLVSKLSVIFPTGEKSLWLELIYRKITYPYSYSFYGIFKYSFGGEKIMLPYENSISFKTGDYYEGGGNFNFLLNDWIAVQNDLLFMYKHADKYNGKTAQVTYTQMGISYNPNLSFQFKKFRLVQGVFIPLFGKYFPANPQYNISLQYIF